MNLQLRRRASVDGTTLGEMFLAGRHECFTCEDEIRPHPHKVMGATAIWAGTYLVTLTWSNRFKRILPLVNDVDLFTGIRIHPGNTKHDTEGCILPGRSLARDRVLQSRIAFDALFAKLQQASAAGEAIWLAVIDP